MSIVVGFGPDTRSTSGVRLAGQLAQATGDDLTLCFVVYDAYAPPLLRDYSGMDNAWREGTEPALESARAAMPDGVKAREVMRAGRSVPRVLVEEGKRVNARLLVVGSSTQGVLGRIGLGATTDRLVHSSALPVALAPRGYQPDNAGVRRIVFAVAPRPSDEALAAGVADLASWLGADAVEIVTFVSPGGESAMIDRVPNPDLVRTWEGQVRQTQAEIVATLSAALPDARVGASGVAEGDRWSHAISGFAWEPGDLLVVGSSEHGALSHVFLGSTGARILRHSPVPVVILPRG